MIDLSYKADLVDAPEVTMPTPEETRAVSRSYAAARPVVDLCRCATEEGLVKAVVEALERANLPAAASRFSARAARTTGPNGLHQIAKDYVKLVRSM